MLKFVLFLIALTIVKIQCQDKTFCDINTIPINPAQNLPPNVNIGKYQARIERNKKSRAVSEEITEYFDGDDNIAVAITKIQSASFKTYSYYKTNELLIINNGVCTAGPLNNSIGATPFYLVIDKNGNEKVLSPLQYLTSMDSFGPLVNINDSVIRNIGVNNWQTCGYSKQTKETLKITVSFVDRTKWTGASGSNDMTPIPVQIQIDTRNEQGKEDTDLHVITEFRPFILRGEEEFYTPEGVYCPGRINVGPIPKVPKQFEFHAEIVQPFLNDYVGFINETREQYDYEEQLFRQDFSVYNSLVTEIHDFTTGLKFRTDQKSGNCTIDVIDGNGVDAEIGPDGLIKIRDPAAFFDFDSNNYQYTGRKTINGAETDVWIGKKVISGIEAQYEWYFLTKKWTDTDSQDNDVNVPILCIITVSAFNPLNNQTVTQTARYSFTNFQTNKDLLLNHDISKCGRRIDKGYYTFKLTTTYNRDKIREKWIYFNKHILRSIRDQAKITMIRITNFDVDMKNDTNSDIIVSFEILDKIGRYGNVKPPEFDVSLKDAIINLENAINGGTFVVNVTLNDGKDRFQIFAKQNTLQRLIKKNEEIPISSGTVAGISIAVAIVGIVLSVALLILHKNKTITLPFIQS